MAKNDDSESSSSGSNNQSLIPSASSIPIPINTHFKQQGWTSGNQHPINNN